MQTALSTALSSASPTPLVPTALGYANSVAGFWTIAAFVVVIAWALCERHERKACQRQNCLLSEASRLMSEQHYRERVSTEERHTLALDSAIRNVLESLERALLGKPRS